MCGIFGFVREALPLSGAEKLRLQGVVMDLAFLNETRGQDGTGLLTAAEESMTVFKEARPASELLRTVRMRNVIKKIGADTLIVLGHTRLATVGAISSRNCHPFVSENFAGVHNGHFLNRTELLKRFNTEQKTDVDSEAVFRVLDGASSDREVAERLSMMFGDFALAFMQTDDRKTLYLIRNVERTLYAVYVPKFKTLLWSSEKIHLQYALARNFMKGNFLEIQSNVLYKINVEELSEKCPMRKIPCEMENPMRKSLTEDDFKVPGNPYLYSFDELRYMGFLEDSNITEKSKLLCSLCKDQVEAGKLFYDEATGGSFCEDCSFDYLTEYEKEESNLEIQNRQYQLV